MFYTHKSVQLYGPRREKPVFGVSDKARFKSVSSATETSSKIEMSLLPSVDIILSKKRITKALTRLRGCAGWSAHVLFANPRRQGFSRVGAQLFFYMFCLRGSRTEVGDRTQVVRNLSPLEKHKWIGFLKNTCTDPLEYQLLLLINTFAAKRATVVEFTVHCQTRLQSKFKGTVDSCLF